MVNPWAESTCITLGEPLRNAEGVANEASEQENSSAQSHALGGKHVSTLRKQSAKTMNTWGTSSISREGASGNTHSFRPVVLRFTPLLVWPLRWTLTWLRCIEAWVVIVLVAWPEAKAKVVNVRSAESLHQPFRLSPTVSSGSRRHQTTLPGVVPGHISGPPSARKGMSVLWNTSPIGLIPFWCQAAALKSLPIESVLSRMTIARTLSKMCASPRFTPGDMNTDESARDANMLSLPGR